MIHVWISSFRNPSITLRMKRPRGQGVHGGREMYVYIQWFEVGRPSNELMTWFNFHFVYIYLSSLLHSRTNLAHSCLSVIRTMSHLYSLQSDSQHHADVAPSRSSILNTEYTSVVLRDLTRSSSRTHSVELGVVAVITYSEFPPEPSSPTPHPILIYTHGQTVICVSPFYTLPYVPPFPT